MKQTITLDGMERARAVILGLIGCLLALSVLLVLPFLEFLLLAILLAYPLYPLQQWLERYVSSGTAALTLVVVAAVAIVLPVLLLLQVVVERVTTTVERFRSGDIDFTALETRIYDLTGIEVDLLDQGRQALQNGGFSPVDGVLGLFGVVTDVFLGVAVSLFLLYYFLKDGHRFDAWLRATVPIPADIYAELKDSVEDVVRAVLASHILIAVIQGAVAGLGLIVTGIPNAIFWTVVMIILAVLPIIGSFMVWGPAAIYLVSIDQPIAGGLLFIYGLTVVSISDDFLRPIIIDRYSETRINPSAIIIGVLGGLYLFGFIGIFFGPVIIGSVRAVLDVYRREYIEQSPPGSQQTLSEVGDQNQTD
jgi:predicted PurR-regulated permease PerM